MRRLTERVNFSLPAEMKARLKARAAERGMSLGALVREITDELIALDELNIAVAEIERMKAMIQ